MRREEPQAKSVRIGKFFDRKRYGSRQKTVTAELKSCGTIYRQVGVKNRYEAELTNQRRG